MSDNLPNWNLKDFYSSFKDEAISKDLDNFKKYTKTFKESYKDKLLSHSSKLEKRNFLICHQLHYHYHIPL